MHNVTKTLLIKLSVNILYYNRFIFIAMMATFLGPHIFVLI